MFLLDAADLEVLVLPRPPQTASHMDSPSGPAPTLLSGVCVSPHSLGVFPIYLIILGQPSDETSLHCTES